MAFFETHNGRYPKARENLKVSLLVPRSSSSQRAGFSNLQTESMNQAAIAHEGHYPEAQVDDLTFCKMLAQDVEGLWRRLPMIARKYLGETNRRLFLRGQFMTAFKMS